MEGLVASKEAELASLKENVRQLEDCDPAAEHKRELDGTAYAPAFSNGFLSDYSL